MTVIDTDTVLFVRACLFWAAAFLVGKAFGTAIFVRFFLKDHLERAMRKAVLELQQRTNNEK